MPEQKRKVPFISLLRLAASEMNMPVLGLMVIAIIVIGYLLSTALATPMLTCFCTAPMPILLLFHQYVLRDNKQMRELERTFKFSYSEMLAARAVVISLYTLLCLLPLSLTIHHVAEESFLRLVLCGATPSVFLCTILLWISHNFRHQNNIALIAAVQYIFLFLGALYFAGFILLIASLVKRSVFVIFICGGCYMALLAYYYVGASRIQGTLLDAICNFLFHYGFNGFMLQESFSKMGAVSEAMVSEWSMVWRPVLFVTTMIIAEFASTWLIWRRREKR